MFLQRGRRRGIKRGVFLLPNLCTTANLFCGFFAIVSTLQMEFVTAAVAIIAGGIFDFLDGRVARLANAESEFGIEYDSLVDLASFGLAPGILMYFWSLSGFPRVGWLVAFLYFACGALRLARFNVQIDSVEKNFFQGLPIPSAAYMIATTVILHDYISDSLLPKRSVVMVGMVAVLALLMVSTIRYRSFKHMDFHTRWPFFSLVLTVGTIFIIASEPQITLFVLVLLYVVSGLAEELITLRKSRALVQRIKERRDAHRGGHRPSDVHGFDQSGEDLH
ncbi:MAG: CDP-diacylglycerol--serine O-phosphatidyltransferase [Deltaproteobacteria bacterium CG11_big_fil_rev_8_21_14_0_20_47_16]|nr:MAG: CDP-diacylglycerol--serine O-phosphatidyltransferase [Deltaproteobacteria bacterium CG11_big_fil_rev_8_21_14_0_20_47_16]